MTTAKRPAAAKQPADRKPSKPRKGEDGRLLVTVRGTEYAVNAEALDDYDVLENLSDGDFIPALRALLDPEQIQAVKAELRDPETGRLPASTMAEFFSDLMGALNPS